MIVEGFGLLAAGMGMVFAFLILLVFVMMVSAWLFGRFPAPSGEAMRKGPLRAAEPPIPREQLAEIAAAIAAAKARSRI